jgi:hypothetical protein
MVIYHIDMVILDIGMGYGLMIWEMSVSMRSVSISIWDILSLCFQSLPDAGWALEVTLVAAADDGEAALALRHVRQPGAYTRSDFSST